MSADWHNLLACPACHGPLVAQDDQLACVELSCPAHPKCWPVVGGVPVLIDESRSLLRIADLVSSASPAPARWSHSLLSGLFHLRPTLSRNLAAQKNYEHLRNLLQEQGNARVLVVGCGQGGAGIDRLSCTPGVDMVLTDVRWTGSVMALCDGHQLPFQEASFDAAVVQAVLEHVLDCWQVIREVTRILKPGGLVYSEWPFLQPVHGGAFDFVRLTHVGHRQAWAAFEELDSGVCCGPGMAVAQVVQAALRSALPGRSWSRVADWLTDWTFWWLKYVDPWLVRQPAALDAASGYYFMGRKIDRPVVGRQIIGTYRGAQR